MSDAPEHEPLVGAPPHRVPLGAARAIAAAAEARGRRVPASVQAVLDEAAPAKPARPRRAPAAPSQTEPAKGDTE